MNRDPHSPPRGVALIIVLAIVAILSVLVLEFSHSVWVDLYLSANYDARTQALNAAKAGVEYGIYLLRRDDDLRVDSLADQWAAPIELTIGELEPPPDPDEEEDSDSDRRPDVRARLVEPRTGGTARVLILDEDRKVPLNMLNYRGKPHPFFVRTLERLIEDLEVADAYFDPTEIVEAMADWADADETGSWEYVYETLTDPYEAKNRPFDTVHELGLVAEMRDALLYGTVPYPEREPGYDEDEQTTAWPEREDELGPDESYGLINFVHAQAGHKINVNTAPREVLAALFDGNTLVADEIIERRREDPFANSAVFGAAVQTVVGDEDLLREIAKWVTFSSRYFRITAIGEYHGVKVKVTAIVHRTSRPDVLVQYYRIENVE